MRLSAVFVALSVALAHGALAAPPRISVNADAGLDVRDAGLSGISSALPLQDLIDVLSPFGADLTPLAQGAQNATSATIGDAQGAVDEILAGLSPAQLANVTSQLSIADAINLGAKRGLPLGGVSSTLNTTTGALGNVNGALSGVQAPVAHLLAGLNLGQLLSLSTLLNSVPLPSANTKRALPLGGLSGTLNATTGTLGSASGAVSSVQDTITHLLSSLNAQQLVGLSGLLASLNLPTANAKRDLSLGALSGTVNATTGALGSTVDTVGNTVNGAQAPVAHILSTLNPQQLISLSALLNSLKLSTASTKRALPLDGVTGTLNATTGALGKTVSGTGSTASGALSGLSGVVAGAQAAGGKLVHSVTAALANLNPKGSVANLTASVGSAAGSVAPTKREDVEQDLNTLNDLVEQLSQMLDASATN